jgi:hypothetical protein
MWLTGETQQQLRQPAGGQHQVSITLLQKQAENKGQNA